jgi:hypothetical protein
MTKTFLRRVEGENDILRDAERLGYAFPRGAWKRE